METHQINSLRETGRLLSHLYLHELTPNVVEELKSIGGLAALSDLGIHLPNADDEPAFEELATEYFETLVNPKEFPPPIQSIVATGTYEGDAARSMREIAKAAGVTFDPKLAGGAPVDHLGSQLSLWVEVAGRDQEAAAFLAKHHLGWAKPLLRHQKSERFYGHLAQVTFDFLEVLETLE